MVKTKKKYEDRLWALVKDGRELQTTMEHERAKKDADFAREWEAASVLPNAPLLFLLLFTRRHLAASVRHSRSGPIALAWVPYTDADCYDGC
jgi:hypothetical protein